MLLNKKIKKFDIRIHPEYDYVDLKEYFENLCDQKYIKKNTFSILYHQMFNLINKIDEYDLERVVNSLEIDILKKDKEEERVLKKG